MSFKPPQPFRTRMEGSIRLNGLPTTYTINAASIPRIRLGIEEIPRVRLAVEEIPSVHLSIEKIPKIQLGVDPVELRLTEFPSIRGHLPADFSVGLSVLGMDLAAIRLCGEAQIITEPYRPNPCEICTPMPQSQIDRDAAPAPLDPTREIAKA
jgi:hypothetical protein